MIGKLLRDYNNCPIRVKYFIVMIPVITVSLIIYTFFIGRILTEPLITSEISNLIMGTELINQSINELMENIDEVSVDIIGHSDIQDTMDTTISESIDTAKIYKDLLMSKSKLNDNAVESILYIDIHQNVYSSQFQVIDFETIKRSRIFSLIDDTEGEMVWLFNTEIIGEESGEFFYIGRKVKDLNSFNRYGYLIFEISSNSLDELIETSVINHNYLYIRDSYNRILYSQSREHIGLDFEQTYNLTYLDENIVTDRDGVKYLQIENNKNLLRWEVVASVPYNVVIAEVLYTQRVLFVMMIVIIVTITYFIWKTSMSLTKPIERLLVSMQSFDGLGIEESSELERNDEIGILTRNFEEMKSKIYDLFQEVKKEHELLVRAQMQALIHQINPHFLYNTLDNINMIAQMSNDNRISELITSLSKLLHISLSKGKDVISTEDEIEHVKSYLAIQKIRFGNRFNYTIELEESARRKQVIKLILQPLVENSIMHGFNRMDCGGQIEVKAYCIEEKLFFTVRDNGAGIGQEKIQALNGSNGENSPSPQSSESSSSDGYGTNNIITRLRLYYADSAKLTFHSNAPYDGVTVEIVIQQD